MSPLPGSPEFSLVPCHSHLSFSTLANQLRRNFSYATSLPDTEDPCCDALLAADELAAIAIGADPAFMTVSSGGTYLGRIVGERVKINAATVCEGETGISTDTDLEAVGHQGDCSEVKRRGMVSTWNRDAAGWQVVDIGVTSGEAGQRKGHVSQTAVLAMLTGACFGHGWKVTITISELCG